MQSTTVLSYIEKNREFLFPNSKVSEEELTNAMLALPDFSIVTLERIPFKNPKKFKLISFFVGALGVDRFILGDWKMGILKYFTFAGAYIWWLIDFLHSADRCKAYNCQKLLEAVRDPSVVNQMVQQNANFNHAVNIAKAAAPVVKGAVKGAGSVRDTFYASPH